LLIWLYALPALAAGPGLGVPISNQDLKEWDMDIPPSGRGLPSGRGTAIEGAGVYAKACQSCHGKNGQSGQADELVGGVGSLASPDAERTVGSFWPYSTTLFDYIRRAMPWDHPGSLTNDQLYSVAAWILAQNSIISPDTILDKTTLPKVLMPNRNGFFIDPKDQK
jgi:cytochrome c